MLVLRLLVMVMSIICLLDGHTEVSSSTTGIRNGEKNPTGKPNEPEVQILDRKKKKPKKPKKPKKSKGKKSKGNKSKTPKPVTTTLTASTTTNAAATTSATTISSGTTTTTGIITVTTTITTTTITTSTKTTSTTTTKATSTKTTPTTTIAAIISTAGPGDCKATNGKPCIFPFKDGDKEYSECKNHGGKYFWCATAVYASGKYKHWSYCPNDKSCPFEGDGECRATNNKPCVFPFKDGKKEYNECADFGGKYFWCATSTNAAGQFTNWEKCPKDGSCPLQEQSTTAKMTSTATTASTTAPITGTTSSPNKMEEKVLDTLENLVLGESRDDSLQIAHMLDEKLEIIIKTLEGEDRKKYQNNSGTIDAYGERLSATKILNQTNRPILDGSVRDGPELGVGRMFVLSTVDSMKSVSRVSDCCIDCKSKYHDTDLAEYWETLKTCYCYKRKTNVEPLTRASNDFTTENCEEEVGDGRIFILESVAIKVSVNDISDSSSCCSACKAKLTSEDIELFEYFKSSRTCFCYTTKPGLMPRTESSNFVASGVCDSVTCKVATEDDCPPQYTFIEGGFSKIPDDLRVLSKYNKNEVKTKCDCRRLCDLKGPDCLAFIFHTCGDDTEPLCILLRMEEPTSKEDYLKHYAFCKRDLPIQNTQTRGHACELGAKFGAGMEFQDNTVDQVGEEITTAGSSDVCGLLCKDKHGNKAEVFSYMKSSSSCRCFKTKSGFKWKTNDKEGVSIGVVPVCTDVWRHVYQGVSDWKGDQIQQKNLKIFGGDIVNDKDKWPWVAHISIKQTGYCTGSLISCDIVVTAQHCIMEDEDKKILRPVSDFIVWIGGTKLNEGEDFGVYSYFYIGSEGRDYDDIALLKLAKPIDPQTNKFIRPIALLEKVIDPTNYWILGFGLVKEIPFTESKLLQETDNIKITGFYDDDRKNRIVLGVNPTDINKYGICRGDSGGPGMIQTDRWFLNGVTATGKCDEATVTGHNVKPGNIGTQMSIPYYLNELKWISPHIGLDKMEILGPVGSTSEFSPSYGPFRLSTVDKCSGESFTQCRDIGGYCIKKAGHPALFQTEHCDNIGGTVNFGVPCDNDMLCCQMLDDSEDDECKQEGGNKCVANSLCTKVGGTEVTSVVCDTIGKICCKHDKIKYMYTIDKCYGEGGRCMDRCQCQGELITKKGVCENYPSSFKCCKIPLIKFQDWEWCKNSIKNERDSLGRAVGFRLNVEPINKENVGINGIELKCERGSIGRAHDESVQLGKWHEHFICCPTGQFLSKVTFYSKPFYSGYSFTESLTTIDKAKVSGGIPNWPIFAMKGAILWSKYPRRVITDLHEELHGSTLFQQDDFTKNPMKIEIFVPHKSQIFVAAADVAIPQSNNVIIQELKNKKFMHLDNKHRWFIDFKVGSSSKRLDIWMIQLKSGEKIELDFSGNGQNEQHVFAIFLREVHDNTGLENIDFGCTSEDGDKTDLLGTHAGKKKDWEKEHDLIFEDGQRHSLLDIKEFKCKEHYWICGMSLQRMEYNRLLDNRGVDQIKFQCCKFKNDV